MDLVYFVFLKVGPMGSLGYIGSTESYRVTLLLILCDRSISGIFSFCFLLSINFTLMLHLQNFMFFSEIPIEYLVPRFSSVPVKAHDLCLNP